MLLICSQNAVPHKVMLEIDEEELKRDNPHVDGMYRAFMTRFSPIRMQVISNEHSKKTPFKFN